MRNKRLSFILVMSLFLNLLILPSSANFSYNPELAKIGMTAEMYAKMSPEKKAFYQDFKVGKIETNVRYFRVSETDSSIATAATTNSPPTYITTEVSETEFFDNVEKINTSGSISTFVSDRENDTWYAIATNIIENANNGTFAISVFLNIYSDTFPSMKYRDAYIASGVNANMSPITNSECCYVWKYSKTTVPVEYEDYISSAPHKGNGYGFDFLVDNGFFRDYTIAMYYTAQKNVSTLTVADAYGFAGYWDNTVDVSLSVSSSGSSINLSPTANLVTARDTHAQIIL